jgi:hypothetical protein
MDIYCQYFSRYLYSLYVRKVKVPVMPGSIEGPLLTNLTALKPRHVHALPSAVSTGWHKNTYQAASFKSQ